MPFGKTPDVAQYGGADWSDFIRPSPTVRRLPRIATRCAEAGDLLQTNGPVLHFNPQVIYDVTKGSRDYLSLVSRRLYGEGTVEKPDCLS